VSVGDDDGDTGGGQAQARFGLWLAEIPEVVITLHSASRAAASGRDNRLLPPTVLAASRFYSLGQLPWNYSTYNRSSCGLWELNVADVLLGAFCPSRHDGIGAVLLNSVRIFSSSRRRRRRRH
jgi:hypothetical protein